MKIRRSLFVDQECNSLYAATAIAVSVFVFAYSSRFGQVSILLYYALWLPLIMVDHRRVLSTVQTFPIIYLFAALAVFSVFWSQAPGATLRGGIQMLSHVICATFAASVVSHRSLSIGVLFGTTLVLLYSLFFGRYSYNPIDGSYTFVGLFSSKNQLGFFASLGLIFGFFNLFYIVTGNAQKILCLGIIFLSAYILAISSSATSIVSVFITLIFLFGLMSLSVFTANTQKLVFFSGLVLAICGFYLAIELNVFEFVLALFGKDSTLTGRTYLWSEGFAAATEAPWFGWGYLAYWVQGFSEAERLWAEFYIESRTGFHFHNTYIEALVELGYVGAVLLIWLLMSTLVAAFSKLMKGHFQPESMLACSLLVLLTIRSVSEVDILTPYTIGSFIFYFLATKLRVVPRRNVGLYLREGRYGGAKMRALGG
ncbi:MAG: O-antigen ligase family protein [Alphaproteobacteria bacterium]|nr:O-antigen ligase family protein [Alphaproteobacteria bacterium]